MGFIKHALIGIALYEVVKYALKKSAEDFSEVGQLASAVGQPVREEVVDVIAGARQTDQLQRLKENAVSGEYSTDTSSALAEHGDITSHNSEEDLAIGSDPDAPLTGQVAEKTDPWKKSLANDELRPPDS